MAYGTLRLTIERKCHDCGSIEEIRTTKYTEEHRELVLDEETSRDFSPSFKHDGRCSYSGPARITTRIHSVTGGREK